MTGLTGADRNYFYGGGPPPKLEEQINLEFQAGTLIRQASVGQSRPEDTIDNHVLNGMPYGWNRSDPNKPTLEFPLMILRVLKEDYKKDDGQFTTAYENLKNQLPVEIRNRLNEEMNLPIANRSQVYSALHDTLQMGALLLVWLANASSPSNLSSSALRLALQNINLSTLAMAQIMGQLQVFVREGARLLRQIGANHPHYAQMLKYLAEAEEALRLIKQISDEEQQRKKKRSNDDENSKNERLKRIKMLIDSIDRIHRSYQNTGGSNEMQIFGTLINAMSLLAKTQTLDENGLRSLLLRLLYSQTENERDSGEASFIGDNLKSYLKTIALILSNKAVPEINVGLEAFYTYLMTFGMVGFLTAALYFLDMDTPPPENAGAGTEELKTLKDNRLQIQSYCLMNVIRMILDSDIISHLIKGPDMENEGIVLKSQLAVEYIGLGLFLKSVALHDKELSRLFFSGLSADMEKRAEALEEALSTYDPEVRTNQDIDHRQIEKALLHLAESRISLKKNHPKSFFQATESFISTFCPNFAAFDQELELIHKSAAEFKFCFTKDYKDFRNSPTGVVQI